MSQEPAIDAAAAKSQPQRRATDGAKARTRAGRFFISLLIFFLTFITELSQLYFWLAVFMLALIWPYVLMIIAVSGRTTGLATLFACVASVIVPLFTGIVFGLVIWALKRTLAPARSGRRSNKDA